tara:strand:+ start:45 stop:788 length:744 start_codon:yes stop_codon:yes gene_type:complete
MYKKKVTQILSYFFIIFFTTFSNVEATDECFEGFSRAIFKFNMAFDETIFEPVAKGYNKLPNPIKKGTSNFTSNISTLLSIPNSLLQGNFKQLGHATGSVIINTSVGVLGLMNPAEKMGLKAHKEDVGQTLGLYGFGTGCYFVLPILGPTTARDTIGLIADTFIDPFAHITIRENELLGVSGNSLDYYSVKGTSAIDFRSENLTSFDSLEKNSLDLYSSYKSVYLQNRENKIKNSTSDQEDWDNLDK